QKAAINMPDNLLKWRFLAYCPQYFDNETQIDKYWSQLDSDLDEAISENPIYDWHHIATEGFTPSFNLPHLNRNCRSVKEKFAAFFGTSFNFSPPKIKRGKKIRVGFLFTPGHEGGGIRLNRGIIDRLDADEFEVAVIYSDAVSAKFTNVFSRQDLVHIKYPGIFEKAVDTIRESNCDAIYYWKIGADTWNYFFPMCRLSPKQFTSWGTHGTSGIDCVDSYLSWDRAEIKNAQEHYSEQLAAFGTYPLYAQSLDNAPPAASRKTLGLPDNGAIYLCPHRPPKYHPMFDEYLLRILENDPLGHLYLLLGEPSLLNSQIISRLRRVIPENLFRRIVILPQLRVADYYKLLSVSDVVLHSPCYSGEITTQDAIWYGIPCVSLRGELLVQRYTHAFYDMIKLQEIVANDISSYVNIAIQLGTNTDFREDITASLRELKERLFEDDKVLLEWKKYLLENIV
ncbi:MAG: hypothetical protein ACRC2T_14630, partial [Thermoguttaceae bacterium]